MLKRYERPRARTPRSAAWVLGLAFAIVCGCGSGEVLYDIAGSVTFDGQPIPEGSIVFEPDASQGNMGPAGRAKIVDGRFDTRDEPGRGTIGGPHLVTIMGMDGKMGGDPERPGAEVRLPNPLFRPYQVTVELPKENGTMDFEVPAD